MADILVSSADQSTNELIASVLREDGYSVVYFTTVDKCVRRVTKSRCRVCLVDRPTDDDTRSAVTELHAADPEQRPTAKRQPGCVPPG